MFRFADPSFLLLLLFIPAMIYYYCVKIKTSKIKYPTFSEIKQAIPSKIHLGRHFLFALRLLIIALIIFCLARPQYHQKVREVLSSGIDIMLTIDTSGSMETPDFFYNGLPVSRLSSVKKVVNDFISKRTADRIGMVVFGTDAFTQCPITLDHGILKTFLKDLYIGMAGEATGLGSAIGVATKRLKDIDAKSKIIILLTDGRNNAGQIAPITAAEIAKTFGIKIYTIGVGSKESSRLSLRQMAMGQSSSMMALDEKTLQEIAKITGGKFFKASDTEKLQDIYKTIDKLEKTEVKIKEYGLDDELFENILLWAFLLLLIEVAFSNTILAKIP